MIHYLPIFTKLKVLDFPNKYLEKSAGSYRLEITNHCAHIKTGKRPNKLQVTNSNITNKLLNKEGINFNIKFPFRIYLMLYVMLSTVVRT